MAQPDEDENLRGPGYRIGYYQEGLAEGQVAFESLSTNYPWMINKNGVLRGE